MGPTTDQSILDQLSALIGSSATNVPIPTIAPLDWKPPSGTDIEAKWREFLTRASQDPDIVNYYQKKLDQAQGDTKLAISFLEKDYQTNTRQTKDNLTATLENLGLQSMGESQNLADTLNKRGIALTQGPNETTPYAGGGQPKTEVDNLGSAQRLRKEAEVRSAQQGIESAGLTREKGITTAGQNLVTKSQDLQKSKEQDILARGQSYQNIFTNQQAADRDAKLLAQKNSGSSGSSSDNGSYGGYNSKNEWFKAKTGGEIAPVGWNG